MGTVSQPMAQYYFKILSLLNLVLDASMTRGPASPAALCQLAGWIRVFGKIDLPEGSFRY
eukprot:SAG31_NODE_18247_length_642_cov_1.132597_1_plen_59_part_01